MKNKNGFTLVEIIVVILLITGISTSIFIVNINNTRKNNNLRLEKLHNQILEAANVFITTEKDESNSYKFDSVQNNGKSAPVWTESIFKANSVKPAIIINLSSKKLNGSGTISQPFEVVDKE